jgi:hypothetical protein
MSTEPFLATRLSVFGTNDHPQVKKQISLGEIKTKKKARAKRDDAVLLHP